ncbi:hypothetical protein C8039_15655 [Halogeometricum sp. wsp3]|nr:hypothetical protein C8039_15655 [Halogeometricum sp. wsp3]
MRFSSSRLFILVGLSVLGVSLARRAGRTSLGREPERAEWATSQPGQGEADNRSTDSGDSVGGHD